jgi:hypothetical protein
MLVGRVEKTEGNEVGFYKILFEDGQSIQISKEEIPESARKDGAKISFCVYNDNPQDNSCQNARDFLNYMLEIG